MITGDGKTVIERGSCGAAGKRILAAGGAEELRRLFPEGRNPASGCTLMPGMIDMHTHIGYYYGEKNAERLAEDRMLRAYFIEADGRYPEGRSDHYPGYVQRRRHRHGTEGGRCRRYLGAPRITSLRGRCALQAVTAAA